MSRIQLMCASLLPALLLLAGLVQWAPLRAQTPAPMPTQQPVVLFDEGHFNNHTTQGSYSQFAELLRKGGYRVIAHTGALRPNALEQVQVLVVVSALSAQGNSAERETLLWRWTPEAAMPAFTDNECDTVAHWVSEGGGLLLIVDHPPYPAAARSLAQRFGVDMRNASTLEPTPGNYFQTPSTLVFSRANGLLGDHAITRGEDPSKRISAIMTFAGSSLTGPPASTALLTLSEAAYDRFFESAGAPEQRTSARGRAQGVALPFHRGRIVVLGEAAVFRTEILEQLVEPSLEPSPAELSAHGQFGNHRLALNVVDWLSRRLSP